MLPALLALALLGREAEAGAPEHAPGDEHGSESDHPGQHHADHPWLVGVKLGFLSILEPREEALAVDYLPAALIGVFVERTLVHEWLELELSVPIGVGLPHEPALFVPIDLHFKKPFHPSPRWSPYLAIGPILDLLIRPELEVFGGLSFALGTYLWFSRRVGLDLELDYNIVFESAPVHELLFAVGPAFRL